MVRKKYNVMGTDTFMELGHKERNKMFYDIVSQYKVCVVPHEKMQSFDKLPHFAIIEANLADIKKLSKRKKNGRTKEEEEKKKKEEEEGMTRFDPRNVKGNIELFRHINDIQSLKLRGLYE